jgi:hypothetical protein
MTSRMDIWRAAKLLVDQHGAETPIKAAAAAGISERHMLRILAGRRGLTPGVARRLEIDLGDGRPQAIEREARLRASAQARLLLRAALARRPGI